MTELSAERLRELLQHEHDNATLRAERDTARQQLAALRAVVERLAETWDPHAERQQMTTLMRERDELLAALRAVVETNDDCPLCDRGRLRNPEKTHWPECPFGHAQAVIARVLPSVQS